MKLNLYSNNTRFAPSPTGHMHLGHVFSALFGHPYCFLVHFR